MNEKQRQKLECRLGFKLEGYDIVYRAAPLFKRHCGQKFEEFIIYTREFSCKSHNERAKKSRKGLFRVCRCYSCDYIEEAVGHGLDSYWKELI